MAENIVYIKNMVCDRCIMVMKEKLRDLTIPFMSVKLGEVVLSEELSPKKRQELEQTLLSVGFELIDTKKIRFTEQVKNSIIELVHRNNSDLKVNLSDYISQRLHHDYNYISNLFTEIEGVTIAKYFIAQKIERVKELLMYDELSLNEIADMLNYSSVAHLSSQFKQVTGITPSAFKQLKENSRKPLDKV